MTELPGGWASGQLSEFVAPRGEKVSPQEFPDLPFIGMDHVEAQTTKIVGSVPSGQMKSKASRFCKDDVLYGRLRPYLNKVAQPKFSGLASGEFIVFEGNELIDPSFLRYRLHAVDFVNFASHLNEGDRPRVSFDQIGNFEVLVPPPEEQRRIVEKIETLFDEIDQGVESLGDAKRAIELYRQSLLKSAFEGRLTADWRAKNPDKLQSPDVPLAHSTSDSAPWPRVHIRSLLDAPLVNGRSVKEKEGGFPVLRLTALKGGEIHLQESKEGDWREDEAKPFLVKRGDIFVSRGNGSKKLVGIGGQVVHEPMRVAFPDTMIRLRLDTNAVQPQYFILAWNSWTVRQQIEVAARTTAGIYKIHQGHVRGFVLPLPSLAEQSEIVNILEERLESASALEAETNENLTRADALRQSILRKAFSGKLVPQEPDDEPAQALLARIRANRDGDSTTKPRKPARRRAGAIHPP